MPKFRKKPVVIEATQWFPGVVHEAVCYGLGLGICPNEPHLHTIHGDQVVKLESGDFVIWEADGVHAYPCKPDIFEATYEPVDETAIA